MIYITAFLQVELCEIGTLQKNDKIIISKVKQDLPVSQRLTLIRHNNSDNLRVYTI